jgi:hypothetical protein
MNIILILFSLSYSYAIFIYQIKNLFSDFHSSTFLNLFLIDYNFYIFMLSFFLKLRKRRYLDLWTLLIISKIYSQSFPLAADSFLTHSTVTYSSILVQLTKTNSLNNFLKSFNWKINQIIILSDRNLKIYFFLFSINHFKVIKAKTK